MKSTAPTVLTGLWLLALAGPAFADSLGPVEDPTGYVYSEVRDSFVYGASPFAGSPYVATQGPARAETGVDWRAGEAGAELVLDFDHRIEGEGGYYPYARSYGEIRFRVVEATDFVLSGSYGGEGRGDMFQAHTKLLRTSPSAATKLQEHEYSIADGASLALDGSAQGTNWNQHAGSPSGSLEAGWYTLWFDYCVYDIGDDGFGAWATGALRLTIGTPPELEAPQVQPVPEPTSLALLALGALALLLRRRP